jgi:hypothetical protein
MLQTRVGMQAGAVDNFGSMKISGGRVQHHFAPASGDVVDLCPCVHFAAQGREKLGKLASHGCKINYRGTRYVQAPNSGSVRLQLAEPLRRDHFQAFNSVRLPTTVELIESRQLF